MWIEISPRRPDFCGQPPCGLCYRWGEDNGVSMSALERMSLELTGKFLDELTPTEKEDLEAAAAQLHWGALLSPKPPENEPPQADIGMSDAAHMDGWLAQHKAPLAPIKPLQLTLDQRDDWQEPVEKSVQKQAQKVKDAEKMEEAMKLMSSAFNPVGPFYNQYLAQSQQGMNQLTGLKSPIMILDDPVAELERQKKAGPSSFFWGNSTAKPSGKR